MIQGNLYRGSRQPCLSLTCLLIRLHLTAATATPARATLRSHYRQYTQGQPQWSDRSSLPRRPLRTFRSRDETSRSPFEQRPPKGDSDDPFSVLSSKNSISQKSPPRSLRSLDFNGPPQKNGPASGREWGHLTQRPSRSSSQEKGSHEQGSLGQLANTITRASYPLSQPKGDLKSKPNPAFGVQSKAKKNPHFETGRRDAGAGARLQQPRLPQRRASGAKLDSDGWASPSDREAGNGIQQQPLGIDLDPDSLDIIELPRDDLLDDTYEHRRKPRKAKTPTTKPKPRQRRRSGREEDEDEYFDDEWDEEETSRRNKKRRKSEKIAKGPTPILLPQFISVANLGVALRVKSNVFLGQLAELGFEDISLESIMTGETAALVAQEYGYEPTVDSGAEIDLKNRPQPEDPSLLAERPPIVTIMGHVDHGKTTMLDWLRRSSVAAQEHGGITQHIGAFSVKLSTGKQITFLDTPGHAAFLSMRQRGANVTDIIILVVAADDSVKPQTLEALKHAHAAKVPIIVAINKIDKDEARVDHVKADLSRNGVEIEDFGGDVQVVCVSGRTGEGMGDLEEAILTLSEILDVRAEADGMAEGWVLESSVKPIGRSASVLVKRGTLRKGDIVAAGATWAKIRVLRNESGAEVDEAPPGTPVEVLGWRELPDAGDEVIQAPNEARVKEAMAYRKEMKGRFKAAAEHEAQEQKDKETAAMAVAAGAGNVVEGGSKRARRENNAGIRAAISAATAEAAAAKEESGPTMVNFTVKGDVMGSVEAVCAAIMEVGNNEVQARVLRSAPGAVTEYDIEHAATTKSTVINFNTPLQGIIKKKAEDAGVTIIDHSVIYHLIDDIKAQLSSHLAPAVTTKVLGEAEVLQVFPINVRGRLFKNVAGCRVRNGQLTRNGLYRVFRRNEKVFEGKLESLKQGKKDATEMRKGSECGIAFEDWSEMEVGDKIQVYEEMREARTL